MSVQKNLCYSLHFEVSGKRAVPFFNYKDIYFFETIEGFVPFYVPTSCQGWRDFIITTL